jgi:GTP-binding protein
MEVTPASLRLRKIYLKEHERKKAGNAGNVMVEED